MPKTKAAVSGPATDRAVALLLSAVKPLERTFRPTFEGIENIPKERPVLFVGNHVVWSGIDILLMAAGLMREADIRIRPLGDRAHFMIPLWRDVLRAYGAVEGSRPNCAKLMREGQCILVYPGGAREVAKRRGEKYKLLWGNRLGFAKMALEHDAIIVPFATVGGEEMWDIVVDANDLLASPIGPLVDKLLPRKDFIAPLVTGRGGGPLPKPVKMYFRFEPPIRVTEIEGSDEEARARTVRDLTKTAVESALQTLFDRRDREQAAKP
jgi:1-acyl-sn-glycerol-3-phosphate acyltransferase